MGNNPKLIKRKPATAGAAKFDIVSTVVTTELGPVDTNELPQKSKRA